MVLLAGLACRFSRFARRRQHRVLVPRRGPFARFARANL